MKRGLGKGGGVCVGGARVDVGGQRVISVRRKPGNKSNPPCAVGLPADFVRILLQEAQVF